MQKNYNLARSRPCALVAFGLTLLLLLPKEAKSQPNFDRANEFPASFELDYEFPQPKYVYRLNSTIHPNGDTFTYEKYVCTGYVPESGTVFETSEYNDGNLVGKTLITYDQRWGPFRSPREINAAFWQMREARTGLPLTIWCNDHALYCFRPEEPLGSGQVPPGSQGAPVSWVIPVIVLLGTAGLGTAGLLALKTLLRSPQPALQSRPPAFPSRPSAPGSRPPAQPYPAGSPLPQANTTFGAPSVKPPVQVALSGIPKNEPLCEPGCQTTPQHPRHDGSRPIEEFIQEELHGPTSPSPPNRTKYQVGEPDLFPNQAPAGVMPSLGNPGVFGSVSEGPNFADPFLAAAGASNVDLLIRLAGGATPKHGAGGSIGAKSVGTPGSAGGGSPADALTAEIVDGVRDATTEMAAAQGTLGSPSTIAIPPPLAQPQVAVVKSKPGPDPRVTDADTTAFAGITVGGVPVATLLTGGVRGQSEAAAVAAGDHGLATAFDDFPEWSNRTADSYRQAYAGDMGAMEAALISQYGSTVAGQLIDRANALNALDAAGVPLPDQLFGLDPAAYQIVENPPAAMLTNPAQSGGFDPDNEATWHQQLHGVVY